MRNDGKAAESFFVSHWESKDGADIERIRDAKDLVGLNGGRKVGDFPKPSDFLVLDAGLLHYAEVKSTEKHTRFPFGDIRPAQKAKALVMAAKGGPYLFYIYSYGTGQWYIMSAKVFAGAVAENRKSITFEELIPWIF